MNNEDMTLSAFIKDKGLRMTGRRRDIMEYFFKCGEHVAPDDLFAALRRKFPQIGRATVYRTLKLFKEADIATQIELSDGRKKFEHAHNKPHHDHMICEKCGESIEFVNEHIEKLQQEAAKKHNFEMRRHYLQIFGLCKKCAGGRKGKR